MSETIIQTAILVFGAGFIGFAIGCFFARMTGTPAGAAGAATPTETPADKLADGPERVQAAMDVAQQPAPTPAAYAREPAADAAEPAPAPKTAAVAPEPEATPEPVATPEPAATPQAAVASEPVAAAPVAPASTDDADDEPEAGEDATRKPRALSAPRSGQADNLKTIKGIGPRIEATLNGLGVYHFDQIATWTPENIAWVDEHLSFRGRILREKWIDQAQSLIGKSSP